MAVTMDYKIIKQYLDKQKIKVVETYDFESKKVKYSEKIKGWKIDKFRGDEEIVRAFVLAKLVNELGYKSENIELEKQYDIGRPRVNKPRIDIFVIAPKIIGGEKSVSVVRGKNIDDLEEAISLRDISVRQSGLDYIYTGFIKRYF